jgi:uncharacterized RDD family membrane protein YckC
MDRADRLRHPRPVRDTFVVHTPENVEFEFELASVGTRALAWSIDVAVMAVLVLAAALVASVLEAVAAELASAALFVAVFLVQWWYGALLEWRWGGRTLGKRLVGLRVIDERGLRVGFVQAVIRNLVRVVDFLPGLYLVGGVSVLLDGRARRLGDLAAGTLVVRERARPRPASLVRAAERHNTFLADPSVRAAARQVTAPERDAMVALALRRDRLPLGVRSELFERLAQHLEQRLHVARPSFFTPEKYVLNLSAVVLAPADAERTRSKGA